MNRIKRLSLLIAVVVTILGPVSLFAFAQEPEKEGVGISPTRLSLEANPGEELKGQVTVLNTGNVPVEYKTYVKDFSIRNEQYEKDFEPVPGVTSPVDWFEVPNSVGSLEPGAQTQVPYTVKVPKDAVPRGYYAVIFAETTASVPDMTGVARLKRVGSLVYLKVKGGDVEKGSVASFGADTWQRSRPVKASVRLQNEGNVHFAATGTVRMKDIIGRTVATTEISGTLLPGTIRRFEPELKVGLPFGLFKIDGDATFAGQTHKLGPKWVMVGSPFWFILWVIIIGGWAVVLIRWIKRRVKSKQAK